MQCGGGPVRVCRREPRRWLCVTDEQILGWQTECKSCAMTLFDITLDEPLVMGVQYVDVHRVDIEHHGTSPMDCYYGGDTQLSSKLDVLALDDECVIAVFYPKLSTPLPFAAARRTCG